MTRRFLCYGPSISVDLKYPDFKFFFRTSMPEVDPKHNGCDSKKVSAKTGKKICCVCKPTKEVRDECIVLNGEEKCMPFIYAHNQCLRAEGFEVSDL